MNLVDHSKYIPNTFLHISVKSANVFIQHRRRMQTGLRCVYVLRS